jgi:hypothetical protein
MRWVRNDARRRTAKASLHLSRSDQICRFTTNAALLARSMDACLTQSRFRGQFHSQFVGWRGLSFFAAVGVAK